MERQIEMTLMDYWKLVIRGEIKPRFKWFIVNRRRI